MHHLAYALSLPERLLRSLVGLVGGVLLACARLLPRPIREGRFYRLAVERQLKMMTDDVGRAGMFRDAEALDAATATRMTIGGALDNLLIVGLHVSPVWVLLAASDVAQEAKAFTSELGAELKKAGVMKEGSRLDSVDDVLEGLATLSGRLAETFDKPPIKLADMKTTVAGLRENVESVAGTAVYRSANLDGLARDLRELTGNGQRSLLEVSAAVAAGAMHTTTNVITGAAVGASAAVRIVGGRLWNDVALDYHAAAKTLARRGFYGSLRAFLRPHHRGFGRLFDRPFLTFTEIGLSFGRWRGAAWAR